MAKKKITIEDFEESLDREVKDIGNAAHVIVPKKHRNKKATVVIGGRRRK